MSLEKIPRGDVQTKPRIDPYTAKKPAPQESNGGGSQMAKHPFFNKQKTK
jgi:hypothetical protein